MLKAHILTRKNVGFFVTCLTERSSFNKVKIGHGCLYNKSEVETFIENKEQNTKINWLLTDCISHISPL